MTDTVIETIKSGLADVEQKLGKKLTQYEGQLRETGDVSQKVREELKALSEKHNELAAEFTELAQKGFKIEPPIAQRSIGQEFVESKTFQGFRNGESSRARIEIKNTILNEAGSPLAPVDTLNPADRLPGIVPGAFRPLTLLDFIPAGTTSSNLVEYTRDSSFTNNAAETASAATKPESDQDFELVSEPVRTIAHTIKISKQTMDDAPAVTTYVDRRLRHGVLNRLQTQIVNGNGTGQNLAGILASGNSTTVVASSGFNQFDFANQLKYAVVTAEYIPTVFMINPADWGAMERLKKGAGDASYIGQEGAINYIANGLIPTLWGVPVIASNAVPATTLICAASDALMMWQRSGVVVEAFEQDQDNVIKNLVTIRAEMRGAFTVFQSAAVQQGTLPS